MSSSRFKYDGFIRFLRTTRKDFLFLIALLLLPCPSLQAEAESAPEVLELEASLTGLTGSEWLRVFYPWQEQYREEQPQAALKYGLEAIDLLSDAVDAEHEFFIRYWTAEAAWYLGDLDLASRLAVRACDVARSLGNQEHEFMALVIVASSDRRRGKPLEAVKHGQRLLEIATGPRERVQALNSLAMTYREMEDLPTALETYLEALRVCEELPRDRALGTLLANIGRVYALMGQSKEAIQNTEESLAVMREFGVERDGAYVLYNLGSYLLEAEKYDQALGHLEEASETLESLGEEGQVPIFIHSEMAIALVFLGREEEALERSSQALSQALEKGNEAWLLKARLAEAKVQYQLGRLRVAQRQLETAVLLSESLDRQFQLAESLEQLSVIHEEQGELKIALDYFRRSAEIQERLVGENHQKQFAEWRARLNFAKAERQLAESETTKKLQEAKLERQRIQRNSLLSSTVLLILLCLGVLVSYRRQRGTLLALADAHELLNIKKKKIEKALAQVSLLSGLLPICASCKSIRNDDGYWQMIEDYISDHSEAEFSHGICPDCAEEFYPGLKTQERAVPPAKP